MLPKKTFAAVDWRARARSVEVLYFAWVRDRVGTAREHVNPPDAVTTVGELALWLATQSKEHAEAFRDCDVLRAAVNQEHVSFAHPIATGDEIAFFPPMTGG